MKLEWLLLAMLVAILAATGAAISLGELPQGHGYTDPHFATLQVGGDGPTRIAPVLWLAWLIGALLIGFFVACLALGLRRRVSSSVAARLQVDPWLRPLLLWGAAFEGVWTALVAVYWRYASSGSTEIWLGLPAPTAIMLYGIWLVPLGFCWLYVTRFDQWVMSEADLAHFQQLVNEARGPGDDEADGDSH